MTARERGFLLLSCCLGDPDRKVLSPAQLRNLTHCVRYLERPAKDRKLRPSDLTAIGCNALLANRTCELLAQEDLLCWYLRDGKREGCVPITRISEDYPDSLRLVLGTEAPGSLWAKGDLSLLKMPKISLVGSRELNDANLQFAQEAGRQAAIQGYALVSGNARGADRAAQEACLSAGGYVISIVADELRNRTENAHILYLSEEGFDLPFSTKRALQRNRLIHSMGSVVLVAQSRKGLGGTWSGTVHNLQKNLRPVCCFQDGSDAMTELAQLGAELIAMEQLEDLASLFTFYNKFI